MSNSFYQKLAVSNIGKNKKTYFPYILTCIFTIMMYYMMSSIVNNSNLTKLYGHVQLKTLLDIGLVVIEIFAVIFLFYTNSFLIKRRKKEIGLYNILGMEKRHIGKMMVNETLIIAITSLVFGLFFGIVFSRLMMLVLAKLLSFEVALAFEVPIKAVESTLILFSAIFIVTLVYNLTKIQLAKPIELLHGGETGEKEPKTKIILSLFGAGCIGIGYWFALTVESPLEAINYFFGAVILVIIGTYALFTTGSIVILKLFRRNKKFYYKTKNFTNISGMLYRMKQNAVGLANICILSTMVLIMFSTTVSLYAGMEDSLRMTYPNDICIIAEMEAGAADRTQEVDDAVHNMITELDVSIENYYSMHSISVLCTVDNNCFKMLQNNQAAFSKDNYLKVCNVFQLDEFNAMNGSDYTLNDGEVLMYSKYDMNEFTSFELYGNTKSNIYEIKSKLTSIDSYFSSGVMENMANSYSIVVKDLGKLREDSGTDFDYSINFDTNCDSDQSLALSNCINKNIVIDGARVMSDCRDDVRKDYFGMYGGFLFIGLFLGILFLMATVLIIYYKQISEGYDDKERFEIMQKVGMSHEEVKKTIRSQVLMVFFLPLLVTAIHIAVSFRIIKKMLLLLGLSNALLFFWCTVIAMLLFSAVYGIVFIITAKSYYKIVSTSN